MYTKEFVDVLVRLSLGQKLLRKDEVLIYLKMRSQWSFVHMFCTVINIWMKLVSLKSINLGIKMSPFLMNVLIFGFFYSSGTSCRTQMFKAMTKINTNNFRLWERKQTTCDWRPCCWFRRDTPPSVPVDGDVSWWEQWGGSVAVQLFRTVTF